ncbi:MAG TPA: riboflavin kinase [Candidatus Limnocylindrales bacterium]|nr:riboflavin kinase [Candidatus Limnocylindrales bacterium]
MRILESIDQLAASGPFVVTVGTFDGPHRGHLRILEASVRTARRLAARPAVVTFAPHPEAVLRGRPPALLSDPAETHARLAAAGIEVLVRQPFDRAFAAQTADDFVRRLAAGGGLRGLVMCTESHLGRDRSGSAAALAPLVAELGAHLVVVDALPAGGERISSSRIRALLAAGALGQAARLLGHRAAVIGTVVHGDGRGRGLGFPTANLAFDAPVALPSDGIYASRVSWGGPDPLHPARAAAGAASLGVRPQFDGRGRLLEVYLLDIDEELYGQRLRVEFVRRLRGERRYDSVDALVAQMARDVDRVRRLLDR